MTSEKTRIVGDVIDDINAVSNEMVALMLRQTALFKELDSALPEEMHSRPVYTSITDRDILGRFVKEPGHE